MKVIVVVGRNDFVALEELEPLEADLLGTVQTHVGHLCDDITIQIRRPGLEPIPREVMLDRLARICGREITKFGDLHPMEIEALLADVWSGEG